MIAPALAKWAESAGVYRDRRVLAMAFLGFSSGLPFGVLAEPLTAWLAESGVDKTSIGLVGLVSLPYSIKFVWAPLMDRLAPPIPGLGRRRGWMLFSQLCLIAAIVALGLSDPAADLRLTAALALVVAFASASQDIVIDAYRVESLDEERMAAGAATLVFGWRLGQVGGGAAGLILADLLPWAVVFGGMAAMVGVGVVATLLNPEPGLWSDAPQGEKEGPLGQRLWNWLDGAVMGPFRDFMTRPGWLAVVLFILLYKFGDAVLAVMKIPFFLETGFTKTEIAEVVKLFGFTATIAGAFLGGWLLARIGIMRGLVVCGVFMAASNLVFVIQDRMGADLAMLAVTITVENMATGMGTTAFVAYLSGLCSVAYTATQYALLTSLMAFSRTVMASGAGWLADQVDWASFFIISTAAAVPGIVLLLWMMRRYPPEPST